MNLLDKRVGILGGGQLAQMLYMAAIKMGLRPVCWVKDPSEPAAQVCPQIVCDAEEHSESIDSFLSQVDCVVFESELVDCTRFESFASKYSTQFQPSLKLIEQLKRKRFQKEVFLKLDIPTAPLGNVSDALSRSGTSSYVLKWDTQGYDGKGVCLNLDNTEALRSFLHQAELKKVEVFAERKIQPWVELAMVGVRSTTGEFLHYPLVLSEQENGVCKTVAGPVISLGLSPDLQQTAAAYLKRLAEELNLCGVFAVEFFLTQEGHLIANEMAPRVHNSGHYTQDACLTDQFENHWRAIFGMPLGSTDLQCGFFIMSNLLGISDPPSLTSRTRLHWYGKKEARPGRKMGHLNGVVNHPIDDINQIHQLMEEMKCKVKIPWSQ